MVMNRTTILVNSDRSIAKVHRPDLKLVAEPNHHLHLTPLQRALARDEMSRANTNGVEWGYSQVSNRVPSKSGLDISQRPDGSLVSASSSRQATTPESSASLSNDRSERDSASSSLTGSSNESPSDRCIALGYVA